MGPLFVVYIAVHVFWFGSDNVWQIAASGFVEGLFKLLIWFLPCVIMTMFLARASLHEAWRQLGLRGAAGRGWIFGLAATLPMAFAAIFVGPRLPDLDDLVGSVLLGPLAEEVLFRGFLFTALLQRAKWSWPAALILSSAMFGLAHLPNIDFVLLRGLALTTAGGHGTIWLTSPLYAMLTNGMIFAAGGLLFGWIYYRRGSLWPAIGLHGFMNLWWDVLRGDRRAVVDLDLPGLAQGLSMLLALVLTMRASSSRTPLSEKLEASGF
jgi:membrane protease YdiL (CAAX protease family)